jgi:hypothetical protein
MGAPPQFGGKKAAASGDRIPRRVVGYFELGQICLHTTTAPQPARSRDTADNAFPQNFGVPPKRRSNNPTKTEGSISSIWKAKTRTGKTRSAITSFSARFSQTVSPFPVGSVTPPFPPPARRTPIGLSSPPPSGGSPLFLPRGRLVIQLPCLLHRRHSLLHAQQRSGLEGLEGPT